MYKDLEEPQVQTQVDKPQPKVCLTGDVHHHIQIQEDISEEYRLADIQQKISEKYGYALTLFVDGKCIDQNREFWKEFSKRNVELGGHTYWSMQPGRISILNKRFFGTIYGPKLYQWIDVKMSLRAFKNVGIKMNAWRTHGYAKTDYAYSLLEKEGVRIVSDCVDEHRGVKKINGLYDAAISCPTDDGVYYHYHYKQKDKMLESWAEVEKVILAAIAQKKDLVLQLHPVCMKVLDNFESYERVVAALKEYNYTSYTISDFVKAVEPAKS